MSRKLPLNFLRYVLCADAASCLACGLLQTACNASLAPWLGLSGGLLMDSGVFLLLYGAGVACLGICIRQPGKILWLLVAGNVAWAVGCVSIIFILASVLTLLGMAYVIGQALMVAALATLQYLVIRQARSGVSLPGNRPPVSLTGFS
jgi:hypothetical protein